MILELDCGNSFVKWRVIRVSGEPFSFGAVNTVDELLAALQSLSGLVLQRCRLVSVRSDDETSALVDRLAQSFAVPFCIAQPAQLVAGLRNGYEQYQLLGMDRWLAMLGAYQLSGASACLVLDLGTAITSDFVSSSGEHLGGFICPGVPLMRNQLRTHTRRIRYHEAEIDMALQCVKPGRSTVEAVERGCLLMLRGFVEAQLQLAEDYLGGEFQLFVTGGDAGLVRGLLPKARVMPDLVFTGLAIACP